VCEEILELKSQYGPEAHLEIRQTTAKESKTEIIF